MVVVRKDSSGAGSRSKRSSRAVEPRELSLPTELSVPAERLQDYIIMLYGAEKIGKTSLAARFPDAFILSFEPGTKALRVFQRPVRDWEDFIGYVDLLETDTRFHTIVIDTLDIAYRYCFMYMCDKLGINHPQDEEDFGKSWGEISKEFTGQLNRLLQLDKGAIILSHASETTIKTRLGRKYQKVVPSAAKQARGYMEQVADVIAYYGYMGTERILTLRGDDYITAGCRLEEHFVTPSGEPVESIPMGNSADEAYTNIVKAFDNKQKQPGGEEKRYSAPENEEEEEEEETEQPSVKRKSAVTAKRR